MLRNFLWRTSGVLNLRLLLLQEGFLLLQLLQSLKCGVPRHWRSFGNWIRYLHSRVRVLLNLYFAGVIAFVLLLARMEDFVK